MYNNKKIFLLYFTCLFLFLFAACFKSVPDVVIDEYGCSPPPAGALTDAGVSLEFAQSTYGEVVSGAINASEAPHIISLASQASLDDRIKKYIRCVYEKRDGYTEDQAAYFDMFSEFMETCPTTDQFLAWQEAHFFPYESEIIKESDTEPQDPAIAQESDIISEKDSEESLSEKDPEESIEKNEPLEIPAKFKHRVTLEFDVQIF
jgi:hypothetical protein